MHVCLQIAQDKAGAAKNCMGTAASVAKLGLKKEIKTFSIYEK
jgi:hypothetical protein